MALRPTELMWKWCSVPRLGSLLQCLLRSRYALPTNAARTQQQPSNTLDPDIFYTKESVSHTRHGPGPILEIRVPGQHGDCRIRFVDGQALVHLWIMRLFGCNRVLDAGLNRFVAFGDTGKRMG